MTYNIPENLRGLTTEEVELSRKTHGFNQMDSVRRSNWLNLLLDILKEPMLLLLFAISIIYLLIGDYGEAIFMIVAIVAVSAISFYQDNRSKQALEELEKLNEPLSKVIRAGQVLEIPTHELVVGDLCITEEGKMINADGRILHSNDFSVNEAALTGESLSVFKHSESSDNEVFSGTLAVSGLAVFEIEAVGKSTRLGKIGTSISDIKTEMSPLQQQITVFVKRMAIIGIVIFLMVCAVNYYHSGDLLQSLLNGLTLAMSVLPEEIPVAFTTFMALGAWKLMRKGIIIKRSSIVETLGSTTVICTDKTGTITENSMQLHSLYNFQTDRVYSSDEFEDSALSVLIDYSMWSSEPVPFDPMEKTIHQVYDRTRRPDLRKDFQMLHEYPLSGKPPMMTHIFENRQKERIIAAKGAPEAILQVSNLSEQEHNHLRQYIKSFGQQGFRVLGVAKSKFEGNQFPDNQQDFQFEFLGFLVFYDPPKAGIQEVMEHIYAAGIQVKVITGDNSDTSKTIAQLAGIRNSEEPIEGKEIMALSEADLLQEVEERVLFTRMFPDAKLTVVNALKQKGEVVAMLGDGVNDGPALKAAHIGVAMGSKGTEIAKAAASLVISNDDLDKLIIGIAAGRRIYSNIKKAIQYIISIHIPIILVVSLPLFLGWIYPQIFTPVHVIFLELIMGPTCSIVYENEPLEKNSMLQKPRRLTDTFLNWSELSISIIQGLLISLGVLSIYQYSVWQGGSEETTRAMVFSTLIFANIWLSLSNRSFYYSLWSSFRNRNYLFIWVISMTLILLAAILYLPAFSRFFSVNSLSIDQLAICFLVGGVSVLWFELYKGWKRLQAKR